MTRKTGSSVVVSAEIRVRGRVQGVGFRPMVWRLATDLGLTGTVCNDGKGVLICATGSTENLTRLSEGLKLEKPPLSIIEDIEVSEVEIAEVRPDFQIIASVESETRTDITPDAATCDACRSEFVDPTERRFEYPFTNCTHCGPRFSIVNSVPYDRTNTTMAAFDMCPACQCEYESPADRRYHAQPIACQDCGPKLWLLPAASTSTRPSEAAKRDCIEHTVRHLKRGKIVAIRGLGGYHLACDATNETAVELLRSRKRRFAKPFALMARESGVVEKYCALGSGERSALEDAAAPIVILNKNPDCTLPDAIAPGVGSLGFLLPHTPMQHLLMRDFDVPLVMTSGNTSHEPQSTDNDEAMAKLSDIADHFLMHDRGIANRIDDSVVRIMTGKPVVLRRARGLAPGAISLPPGFENLPSVAAFGAELKSTFCLLKNGVAVLSQHQGDLKNPATLDEFEKNLALYQSLFDHDAQVLACDRHPEYLSTKLALETSERSDKPLRKVQHHHAHVASCLVENGVARDADPVLGIVMDGLGLGDDGTLWGAEFLLADYVGYERLASMTPVVMPGGAQAVREPWRNTYAQLQAALGWQNLNDADMDLPLLKHLLTKPLATLDRMLERDLNSPTASSCGRLFDAVAAAIDVCRDECHYEGQAAIELENLAAQCPNELGSYSFSALSPRNSQLIQLNPGAMWRPLLNDLINGVPTGAIAARFQNGLANGIADMARQLGKNQQTIGKNIEKVALTGGCFQNKMLLETVSAQLEQCGFNVLCHNDIPSNDGGLALGQAAIAAASNIGETARKRRT
jgi:hydrogenase maturation protein HypF